MVDEGNTRARFGLGSAGGPATTRAVAVAVTKGRSKPLRPASPRDTDLSVGGRGVTGTWEGCKLGGVIAGT